MLLESTRPSSDDLLALVDTEPDRNPAGNARDDTTMPGARGLKRFGVMPHLGDLEAMVERRIIRVLTVYGPGRYFLEEWPSVASSMKYANKLQKVVNKAYQTGLLTVQVVCDSCFARPTLPRTRGGLWRYRDGGHHDYRVPTRAAVDFTNPVSKPLSEILITGPNAPPINRLEDLSGKTVYVRLSSSYAESVRRLSERLTEQGKAGVRIEAIDESLEDEDLIEMVDAGLLPWAVVDSYKPQMWREVFTRVSVREDLVLREAKLAWAIRQGSPRLKQFLNNFLNDNREGTLFGNIIRNRYIRDFDWAENAARRGRTEPLSRFSTLFRKYGRLRHGPYAPRGTRLSGIPA